MEQYAEKGVSNTYTCICHTTMTVWGYLVLKDTKWLPWYLGGSGSLENGFDGMPFQNVDEDILNYALFTYGYHVNDFLSLIILKRHKDNFGEMLLHHIASVSLQFGYIFSNYLGLGATAAFLHDIADIAVT